MDTALVIGAAAVGLFALWKVVQQQQREAAPPPAPPPVPAPTAAGLVTLGIVNPVGLAAVAITNPQAVNTAVTGIDPKRDFGVFGDQSDFERLRSNMKACYSAGNNAACIAVQQQTRGTVINCQPRGGNGGHVDCDANPVDLGGGTFTYNTGSARGLIGHYGPKVPVGGCAPWPKLSDGYDNTKDAAANVAGGYCAGVLA